MSEKEKSYFKKSTNEMLRALAGEEAETSPMFSEETNAIISAIKEGGGGSDLPDVTSADNGKVLGVVNGEWDKTESKGLFVATITYNSGLSGYICDKTNKEILAAIAAGNTVVAKYGDNVYRLAKYLTTGGKTIYFEWSDPSSSYQVKKEFRVGTLGVTAYFEHPLPGPFIATYTITGQGQDGVFPLSCDKTLAQIQAAIENQTVMAKIDVSALMSDLPGDDIVYGYINFAGAVIMYSLTIIDSTTNAPTTFTIIHMGDNSATLTIVPLNTTAMTLDTDTDTLSITGVTEV